MKLKFGHYFATDAWGVVMKLNLGRDSEARFAQDLCDNLRYDLNKLLR